MTQISTEVKRNIILFKDGSQKWITDSVYQQLVEMSEGGKFTVDGNMYDYNMINKVLSNEEFYKEYPQNQPPVYNFLEDLGVKFIKHDRKRALEKMIEGIKGYISSEQYRGTEAPKEILKSWERRYARL